jgi:hypothetical protein
MVDLIHRQRGTQNKMQNSCMIPIMAAKINMIPTINPPNNFKDVYYDS